MSFLAHRLVDELRLTSFAMRRYYQGNVDADATSGEDSGNINVKLEGENGVNLPPVMQVSLRSKEAGIVASQPINDKGVAEFGPN
jgi:hypothetical protein